VEAKWKVGRAGSGCLNNNSASISGASAGLRRRAERRKIKVGLIRGAVVNLSFSSSVHTATHPSVRSQENIRQSGVRNVIATFEELEKCCVELRSAIRRPNRNVRRSPKPALGKLLFDQSTAAEGAPSPAARVQALLLQAHTYR
jgi:hypothetical protein